MPTTLHQLWHDIGISGAGALAVCVSSVCMYAVFAAVLHWWGERLRSATSSSTMALAALIGAISARATLGNYPTLGGGLVALATLLVLERVFGRLRLAVRRGSGPRRFRSSPTPPRQDG